MSYLYAPEHDPNRTDDEYATIAELRSWHPSATNNEIIFVEEK